MTRFSKMDGKYSWRLTISGLAIAAAMTVLATGLAGCSPEARESQPANEGHQHAESDPHAGHRGAGGAAAELMVSTTPSPPAARTATQLRLMIHGTDGSMVKDFEVIHEKQVHLIIAREDLGEFAHIHPEIDTGGNITTSFTFPTGGRYLIYADHKPAGKPQAAARAHLQVAGTAPPAQELSPNVPGEVSGDGLTARVSIERAADGDETVIAFDLVDVDGKAVSDLEPYLGAMGHLVILSANGEEYVHSHPLESKDASDGQVKFAAHFGGTGIYKGWGQFQRAGQVLTVPFVMDVK